jgi:hypothetical protein
MKTHDDGRNRPSMGAAQGLQVLDSTTAGGSWVQVMKMQVAVLKPKVVLAQKQHCKPKVPHLYRQPSKEVHAGCLLLSTWAHPRDGTCRTQRSGEAAARVSTAILLPAGCVVGVSSLTQQHNLWAQFSLAETS